MIIKLLSLVRHCPQLNHSLNSFKTHSTGRYKSVIGSYWSVVFGVTDQTHNMRCKWLLCRAWTGGWAVTTSTPPLPTVRSSSSFTCWSCPSYPSPPSSYRTASPWTPCWATRYQYPPLGRPLYSRASSPGSPPSGGRSGAPWRSRSSSRTCRRREQRSPCSSSQSKLMQVSPN